MSAFFVAGSGTDIGKTYVTETILRQAARSGRAVRALKPVASGLPPTTDPTFAFSDPGRLLSAQNLPIDEAGLAACCPWRYAAPLSPDMAAAAEGRVLPFSELLRWTRAALAARPPDEITLVEGVGGVMSPICDDATNLDFVCALGLPSVLVCGSYLGAISHALTALEAMKARDACVLAVLVNETEGSAVDLAATAQTIRRFASGALIAVMARGAADLPPDAAGLFGLSP